MGPDSRPLLEGTCVMAASSLARNRQILVNWYWHQSSGKQFRLGCVRRIQQNWYWHMSSGRQFQLGRVRRIQQNWYWHMSSGRQFRLGRISEDTAASSCQQNNTSK